MIIYDETDGPSMQLELPVEVVETLIEIVRRYVTPAMGLNGAFIDELRGQLAAHKAEAKPEAEDFAAFSFSPGAIDQHFEDDESTAAALWTELGPEERRDAALTAKGFFENDDEAGEAFHRAVVDGVQTYYREQVVG